MLDKKTLKKVIIAQRNEITENIIYKKLSESVKDPKNKKILKRISKDEKNHYNFWKRYTEKDVNPYKFKIWYYYLISKIFGLTFGLKLMENGEAGAKINYEHISKTIPQAKKVAEEEDEHEKKLIGMINQGGLKFIGSIVLGLNDALVELTGTLAGLSFALQNTRIIAMAGMITGVAASLSMASSEYLSIKSEDGRHPLKASLYTGIAYIITVIFLIFPFFIFSNYLHSLALTIINALVVIIIFTFYTSVAKDLPFKKRFLEMTAISLGVAAISFGIGVLLRNLFGIEV